MLAAGIKKRIQVSTIFLSGGHLVVHTGCAAFDQFPKKQRKRGWHIDVGFTPKRNRKSLRQTAYHRKPSLDLWLVRCCFKNFPNPSSNSYYVRSIHTNTRAYEINDAIEFHPLSYFWARAPYARSPATFGRLSTLLT